MRTPWIRMIVVGSAIAVAPMLHAAEKSAPPSNPGNKGSASVPDSDRKFVMEAAAAGAAEVEMGKLAAKNGSTQAVRDFGERMVKDHTQANAELKKLADARGIQPPAKPDAKHQKHMDRLEKLSGEKFDEAYMKSQREDHKKAVSLFRKQAKEGKDAELKQFAATTLPTLEEHRKLADQKPEKTAAKKRDR